MTMGSMDNQPSPDELDRLVSLLSLKKVEENLFLGESQDLGWGTVYGGQVLGQAISAALQTVPPERAIHSMHAYFLRLGDTQRPILYSVDRLRDGGSFSARRVEAIQGGVPICEVLASFHASKEGFEHQDPMPETPPPEKTSSEYEFHEAHRNEVPPAFRGYSKREHAFDTRLVDPPERLYPPVIAPPRQVRWLRTIRKLGADFPFHTSLFAYVSDYGFLTTSLLPHGVSWLTPGMQIASLDHSIWFHRPFRADEWLLYVTESPTAHATRGLAFGRVYNRDGILVASTSQEGLIRYRSPG